MNIIDQCVAQGVPFAREYGGLLDNRSFGGAQVSRTFYARGQTGQQLLLGAYQALERQIAAGTVEMHTRHEMLDLIVVDGRARGIVVRDLVTGEISTDFADAVVLATGGYGNVFFLSTNAKGCNVTAIWRAHRKGALLRQPLLHADPPDLHPGLRRPPVEADADVRVAAQRRPGLGAARPAATSRAPQDIPEDERDYYLERIYPAFGNLVPRDIASRAAKNVCDEGRGVGPGGLGVYLDFADAISRLGRDARRGEVRQPVRDVRADHRRGPVRGADADLPGRALHDGRPVGRLRPAVHDPRPVRGRRGELLRPRRQPPRRLRADAGPGRRLLRAAQHASATTWPAGAVREGRREPRRGGRGARPRCEERIEQLLAVNGDRTVDSFHRELGKIMWEYCGMERTEEGLRKALDADPDAARGVLAATSRCPAPARSSTRRWRRPAGSADFFELAELMCIDALHRDGVLRRPLPGRAPDARRRGRCATTSSSPTSRPGSTPATGQRRCCTRKPSSSSTSTRRQRSYK